MGRRIDHLKALAGPPAETEREREERRKKIREQAFYAPTGELALSRERVDLRYLMPSR